MKSRKCFAVSILCILCMLTGCSLAKEDAATVAGEDRLIGAFITTEYVDLFDFETYFQDHVSDFVEDEAVQIDGTGYEGRIYATLLKEAEGNQEKYVFENLDGYLCILPTMGQEETGTYTANQIDDMFDMEEVHINCTDDGETLTLRGTLYACPKKNEIITFYTNPVYQQSDGKVYLVSGTGASFQADDLYSSRMSQKVEDSMTTTLNGKKVTNATLVEIAVEAVVPAKEIRIVQMDQENRMLCTESFEPGKLPEVFVTQAETAYLLLESVSGVTGKVTRTLYERGTDQISAYYRGEKNICMKQNVLLEGFGHSSE